MKLNFSILSLVFLGLLTVSCGDDEPQLDNATLIQNYITENNLNAVEVDNSGLFYVVSKEGNGEFPNINNDVTVHYTGKFLNGDVFDSSVARGAPATFPLSGVIVGWQIGIPKFSKGGAGTLIIPSDLAYGSRGNGSIPGNSVLLFDVELINF